MTHCVCANAPVKLKPIRRVVRHVTLLLQVPHKRNDKKLFCRLTQKKLNKIPREVRVGVTLSAAVAAAAAAAAA
jgi:hypothetical protein